MGPASSDADEMFLSVFFFRATVGKGNLKKDQASLTAKCPTENALRAGMPDCESKSYLDRRAPQPKMIFTLFSPLSRGSRATNPKLSQKIHSAGDCSKGFRDENRKQYLRRSHRRGRIFEKKGRDVLQNPS